MLKTRTMLFNSFEFLLFFPSVCVIYFLLKTNRSRLWLLFFSSCFFYGFFILKYLLVLFLLIGIDFYAAQKIEASETQKKKKVFLLLSLVSNISILGFFKYCNFFIENVNLIAQVLHWNTSLKLLQIILPIGLSFHTFQSMAYVLEVYWGRFKAEKDLLTYSIYVLYFPQMVAGPIERPQNIIPQLKQFHAFEYERMVTGFFLIAQGLFKKSVIADGLSSLVKLVFDQPTHFGFFVTATACMAFAFQIYCDFSGYSDIARGISRILGIELMRNFNKPYFARSISDFWRRWHISLSTWFRDYLYIPLGGSRHEKWRTSLNLLAVFSLSGLWHGANWTFVIWGALHGVYLIIENLILKPLGQESWSKLPAKLYVFSLVVITWIFFRAANISNAFLVLKGLISEPLKGISEVKPNLLPEAFILIFGLVLVESLDEHTHGWNWIRKQSIFNRWAIYWMIVWAFLWTAQFSGNQFIYFQF